MLKKHIAHQVQADRLADYPARGAHRAVRKDFSRRDAVAKRQRFGVGLHDHLVITRHLAATLAEEFERSPLHVFCIDPGPTRTALRKRVFPGENPQDLKPPHSLAPLYLWAMGRPWAEVVATGGMEEGDLVMLILRTADNLRHIRSLAHVFPDAAESAAAWSSADTMSYDDVIDPRDTRIKVAKALEVLRLKSEAVPPKKHGSIPL